MTNDDIVKDPFLRATLAASHASQNHVLSMIESSQSTLPDKTSLSQEELVQHSKNTKKLTAHLAQLRGMYRDAIMGVRKTKHDTAEARSEVDDLHLQLQNLLYEQRHLVGEIEACESYE
jgi:THO complex subunit 5